MPLEEFAARIAAVTFIHRFGSTLNARVRCHCVVIDAVFESDTAGGVIGARISQLPSKADG